LAWPPEISPDMVGFKDNFKGGLKGAYKARDPRFVTQAKDLPSHIGYQTWHRKLDEEVLAWFEIHKKATPAEFEEFLKKRYSQPDLLERFPKGLE